MIGVFVSRQQLFAPEHSWSCKRKDRLVLAENLVSIGGRSPGKRLSWADLVDQYVLSRCKLFYTIWISELFLLYVESSSSLSCVGLLKQDSLYTDHIRQSGTSGRTMAQLQRSVTMPQNCPTWPASMLVASLQSESHTRYHHHYYMAMFRRLPLQRSSRSRHCLYKIRPNVSRPK